MDRDARTSRRRALPSVATPAIAKNDAARRRPLTPPAGWLGGISQSHPESQTWASRLRPPSVTVPGSFRTIHFASPQAAPVARVLSDLKFDGSPDKTIAISA